MDLDMPIMDGLADAAAVSELGPAAGGLPADEARTGTTDAGIDGYIANPHDRCSFAADVRQALTTVAPAPGRDVWNCALYMDLAKLVGADRVAAHLGLFEEELRTAHSALTAQSDGPARSSNFAHRLVPAASLLGFEDLTAACADIQAAAVSPTGGKGTAFAAAVDAALAAMPGVRIKVAASQRPPGRA